MIRRFLKWCDLLRHKARWRKGPWDKALGRQGEDLAHRYLQDKNYRIVARNYRTPNGSAELDIIARQGPTVVFVEVKSRESNEFGLPERNVDRDKRRNIIRGAYDFLRRSGHDPKQVRFDIVSITVGPEVTQLRHLENVFNLPDAL
jgi:putative endonuclease